MDFTNLQSNLENLEHGAEQTLEQKQQIESREASIQDAITQLGDDVRLAQLMQTNLEQTEHQRQSVEQELESCRTRVSELQSQLEEMAAQNQDSASILEQLKEMGEDVSEGLNLLEQRQALIDECTAQLQQLLEKLGMNAASLEAAGGKSLETGTEAGAAAPAEQGDSAAGQSGEGDAAQNALNAQLQEEMQRLSLPVGSCGGITALGQIPAGYEQIILNRYDQSRGDTWNLISQYADQLVIQNTEYPPKKDAHYSPVSYLGHPQGVYYNAQLDMTNPRGPGTTYFHELGHMLDHAVGSYQAHLSDDPEFHAALIADGQRAMQIVNAMNDQQREQFQNRLFSHEAHSCSDLLDAVTNGALCGRYGHDREYWSHPGSLQKEAFAHFFEASMGNEQKLSMLASVFPNGYRKFQELISSAGRGGYVLSKTR